MKGFSSPRIMFLRFLNRRSVPPTEAQTLPSPGRRFVALETLRIRDFRFLWVSNGLSFMGQQMRNMAQGWLVLEMTNSKMLLGLANGVQGIPVILLSLMGGVLSDRTDRRTMMLRARLALAGFAFLTAFLITANVIAFWHILLLAILAGGVMAFNQPASQTFVMDIVGRERLLSAISLNSAVTNLGNIIGPSLGGVLIASLGIDAVFYILSGAYVVAFGALTFVQGGRRELPSQRPPLLRDLLDGLAYVRHTPFIAWILFLAFMTIFSAIYFPLVLVYARDVLEVGSKGAGYLLGAQGVGSLLGSLALAVLGNVPRKGRLVVLGAITWNTTMIVFAFSRFVPLSMGCTFIMGFASMFWSASISTLLQTSVPEEMRGRVMSIYMMTMQAIPLGWVLGGALATALGNEAALVIGGTIPIACNVFAYARSRHLRQIP